MSGINIIRTHNDGFNPVIIKFNETKKYLLIPIEESAPEAKFYVINKVNRYIYNIRLAIDRIDYSVPLELTKDTYLEIYDSPSVDALGWAKLELSDTFDDSNHEYYRPNYHLTAKYGWINDPNGLFYLDGIYHCYYQHNPYASVWGNMHWGHATTKDFIHFDHHQIALVPDELGAIFSGCIVIDKENDSGFGKNAVIAFYTNAGKEDYSKQTTSLAFSIDGGYTFKKFDHNPIVTYNCRDFRDPIVIRYKNQWNMLIATQQWIRIYSSQNLKEWKFESEFGRGLGCHEAVWECPQIFQVDGKWVLLVSTKFSMQYFIGEFDGHEFKCEFESKDVKWTDFGNDSYAAALFHDSPMITSLSWMRYYEDDAKTPLKQFRGAFTIPRTFRIHEQEDTKEKILYSLPLPSFEEKFSKKIDKITDACLVEIELKDVTAKHIFFTLKNEHENVDMEINREKEGGRFYFNRGIKSGIHDFGDAFCVENFAPYRNKDHYFIKLFIDKYSIEIFDKEGEFSMTEVVFPRHPYTDIIVDTIDGDAKHTISIKTF